MTREDALAQAALMPANGKTVADALVWLWDAAFEAGRESALDELTPRFCVCMK